MSYVTVQQIRDYVMDNEPEDNEIEIDLSFTDANIRTAMEHAVREYNAQPPIGVSGVNPLQLPDTTNMFFDGTLVHLYTMLLARLRRNDMDFDAGGVKANIVAKRIAHLKEGRDEHRELFRAAARDVKVTANLRRVGGRVG